MISYAFSHGTNAGIFNGFCTFKDHHVEQSCTTSRKTILQENHAFLQGLGFFWKNDSKSLLQPLRKLFSKKQYIYIIYFQKGTLFVNTLKELKIETSTNRLQGSFPVRFHAALALRKDAVVIVWRCQLSGGDIYFENNRYVSASLAIFHLMSLAKTWDIISTAIKTMGSKFKMNLFCHLFGSLLNLGITGFAVRDGNTILSILKWPRQQIPKQSI